MSMTVCSIDEALNELGIEDVEAFLDKNASVPASSGTPLVMMRGNVQLMLHQTITRAEVDKQFSELKYA